MESGLLTNKEIRSAIKGIETNKVLYEETNFAERLEAIDFIEIHIIGRLEAILQPHHQPQELISLKQYAVSLVNRLEEINKLFFSNLQAKIAAGTYRQETLKHEFNKYLKHSDEEKNEANLDYDDLDVFVNELLRIDIMPTETRAREPDMIFYQPTPARVVLELIEKTKMMKEDVLYDLGSGLGLVPILVGLLSEAKAKGIEFEPAYCNYTKQCASRLNLSRIEFINLDARDADYSDGTIFYMYTPFTGKLLQEVLEKLEHEARRRVIRVCSYGPCTSQVSQQSWLKRQGQNDNCEYKLAIFESIPPVQQSHLGFTQVKSTFS